MRISVRIFSSTLVSILAFLLSPGDLRGLTTAQAQSGSVSAWLDEALGQADSERARELVLDDLDVADQLFLRYLQETITQGQQEDKILV